MGEICKVTKLAGFEFTKYVNYSNTGSILAIRGINVKKGKFNLQDVKYIDNSNFSRLSRSKLQEGDILFTYVGTIGNSAIVPKNVNWYLAPNVCLIRPQDKNSSFISYLIQSDRFQHEEILKWITTSSQPALSMENIRKFKIILPLNSEQQKIFSLVSKIDKLITLQQRKLKQLKLLKRAMLQTLFTNKSVPQLRFKGFTDNWEQRKLKDQAIIIMGQSPDGSTYSDKPTKYILVQGNADIQNGWVKPRVWTTQLTKLAKKGDILLSVRAPVGKVGRTNYDVVLGRGVAAIKGNNFLFFLFHKLNIDKYWKKYSTGSTFESINSADIRNTIIHIPQKIEQTRIGILVSHIEKQITFQQNKIKKLESLKRFLLQNMFI